MKHSDWDGFMSQFSDAVSENKCPPMLVRKAEYLPVDSVKVISDLAIWLIQQIHKFRRTKFFRVAVKGHNIVDARNEFLENHRESCRISDLDDPDYVAAAKNFHERMSKEKVAAPETFERPKNYHWIISIELAKEIAKAKYLGLSKENDPLEYISSFIEENFHPDFLGDKPRYEGKELHSDFLHIIMVISNRLAHCKEKNAEVAASAYISNLWGQVQHGLFWFDYPQSLPAPSMALDINECLRIWWQKINQLASGEKYLCKPHRLMTYPFLLNLSTMYLDAEKRAKLKINFNDEEYFVNRMRFVDIHSSNLPVVLPVLASVGDMYFGQPRYEQMEKSRLVMLMGNALNKCDSHYRKFYADKPYFCPIHLAALTSFKSEDVTSINHLGVGLCELLRGDEEWRKDDFNKRPENSYKWNVLCLRVINLAVMDGNPALAEALLFLLLIRNMTMFNGLEPWADILEATTLMTESKVLHLKNDISHAIAVSWENGKKQGVQPYILSRYKMLIQLFGEDITALPNQGQSSTFSNLPELDELLSQNEGKNLEFKSSAKWDYKQGKPNKNLVIPCVEAIAAFLNSSGGILLIGVDDDKNILGIENDLKLVKNSNQDGYKLFLQDSIKNHLGALACDSILFHFIVREEKTVCSIECSSSNWPVYCTIRGEQKFYIRLDGKKSALNHSELIVYINDHFDKEIV